MSRASLFAVPVLATLFACGSTDGTSSTIEPDSLALADTAGQPADHLVMDPTRSAFGRPIEWTPPTLDAGETTDDAGTSQPDDAGNRHDTATSSGSGSGSSEVTAHPYAGLHVVGNTIENYYGEAVTLHGANRSGSEFACVGGYGFFDGPADAASLTAMQSWNINAVRVPLNEDCWLGINGVSSAYAGANYQAAIEAYVSLITAAGMYAIVDLHWNAPGTTLATGQEPMADADHAPAFWTSVASTFKSNGAVVLELYNEPWPDNDQDTTAAWTCWRDGGSCPSVSFEVAGMQTLVTTVRATGATNLVLLGGVEYSNALSQWMTYKPTDSLNNLAAAWHVYEGNTCSATSCFTDIAAPLAAKYPIVATEIGDSSCDGTFLTTVMGFLDASGQSYSAWTWNTWGSACSNYSLISDYTGTPNGAYGLAYQAHLLAL
jgi:endoglucanase